MLFPLLPMLLPMLSPLLLVDVVLLAGGTVHSLVPGEEPVVADLLVEDGRIAAIGADLSAPPGAERLDCTGRHLVPGLIDGLVHFDREHDAFYLAHGVTSVRDAGGEQVRLLAERMPRARERTPGPFLVTAGAVLDGDPPATPRAGIVRNADQARALVPLLAENGADFISIHTNLGLDAYRAIVELAHERELAVWGPRPAAVPFETALELGQDGFLGLDALLPEGTAWHGTTEGLGAALGGRATSLAAAEVGVVPLLAATHARLAAPDDAALARLAGLDEDYEVWWRGEWEARRRLIQDPSVLSAARAALDRQSAFAATLVAAGVELVPGSGAPNPWLFPGAALHDELARWSAAGLDTGLILASATRGAASALGQAAERGQLTVGRVADILVVSGDPTDSLASLRSPEIVVVRGTVLERDELDEVVETARAESAARRREKSAELIVDAPDLPEGHVVLSGRVHTTALERTVTAERFAVVRTEEGSIVYVARVVYPDEEGLRRVMHVSQTIGANGRLQGFEIRVTSGNDLLVAEGIFVAGSLRVRRRLNDLPVQIDSTRERVRAIDVGSVTTVLALGQLEETSEFPVMVFGETLEPQVANWTQGRDARGVWQVTTHRGRQAYQLDELGAPAQVQVVEGRALRTTLLDERDAYGGPGLPPPAWDLSPAAVEAEAPRPEDDDVPDDDVPDDDVPDDDVPDDDGDGR
ncbi:MAG: hypothetical protein WD226_10135 [Planctomycetota bacterium]